MPNTRVKALHISNIFCFMHYVISRRRFATTEFLPVVNVQIWPSPKMSFGPRAPKMGPNHIFAKKVPTII